MFKALAMGASCGGMARAFLQAYANGGVEELENRIEQVIAEIRISMLLSGAQNIAALQEKPLVLSDAILRWIPRSSPLFQRQLCLQAF